MRVWSRCLLSLCLVITSGWYADARTTDPLGGGQPFQNEQPSLPLTYLVNISGSDADLGEVGMFAGNFAPRGWALADGSLLSTASFPDLFSKLGTAFGGNGTTNFALPDLRGRAAIGAGSAPGLPTYTLGQKVGGEQVALSEVPAHSHRLGHNDVYTTESTGSTVSHSNLQPSLALTPIIATQGFYPSQSLVAGTDSEVAPIGIGTGPFLGELTWIAHNDVPSGWAIANGDLLSTQSNDALFSLLGNFYGGDGAQNFALPDLRGRTPVGVGQGPGLTNRLIGTQFGSAEETLNQSHLPMHEHQYEIAPGVHALTSSAGQGTTPQRNEQPSLPVTHLVALDGIYPSRNLAAGTDSEDEIAAIGSGDAPFTGSVSMFAGNFNPRSFARADGQVQNIAQNPALFSLLGIEFGGDGRSTFGLPDLRGRTVVGVGTGTGLTTRILGESFGAESSSLTAAHLPSHSHEFDFLPGDYWVGDGDVDGTDFLRWQRAQSPNGGSPGDLATWLANYGTALSGPLSGSASIPEPDSVTLLFGICLMQGVRRRVG